MRRVLARAVTPRGGTITRRGDTTGEQCVHEVGGGLAFALEIHVHAGERHRGEFAEVLRVVRPEHGDLLRYPDSGVDEQAFDFERQRIGAEYPCRLRRPFGRLDRFVRTPGFDDGDAGIGRRFRETFHPATQHG